MQDFPYSFEEDVEHHNIWSTIPLDEKRMLEVGSPCPSFCSLMYLPSTAAEQTQQPAPLTRLLGKGVHSHLASSSLLLLHQVGRVAAEFMEAW